MFLFSAPCLGQERTSQSLPLAFYEQRGLIPVYPPDNGLPYKNDSSAAVIAQTTRTLNVTDQYMVDLSEATEVDNTRIVLTNTGSTDIVNPWVIVNGRHDWFDLAALLADILPGESEPREKAMRVWRFLRDHRYHWTPAEVGPEMHDPIKMLNVYGYGYCDDSAAVAEALFKAAGLPEARGWALTGHVVPEVFYNDAWHILDPDLEVFYPQADITRLAGVSDCAADGGLVDRISGADIARLYTSADDNTTFTGTWVTSHTMTLRLRPGMSLERCWYHWGKFHVTTEQKAPPIYGNGRLAWTFDLAGESFLDRLESWSSLVQDVWDDRPFVHPLEDGNPGVLVLKMDSPYPFVGGQLSFDGLAAEEWDRITCEFSTDGAAWAPLGQIVGPFLGPSTWALDDALSPHLGLAKYQFWIRLTLEGNTSSAVGIYSLQLMGEIQCAPLALPALEPGRVNTVAVRMDAGPEASLLVEHDYAYATDPQLHLGQVANISSEMMAGGPFTAPTFSWNDSAASYEVLVSWDAAGELPVSPCLWQTVTQPAWTPPVAWLLPGVRYYFHVRAFPEDSWSDYKGQLVSAAWSAAWPFTLQEAPTASRSWRGYR